MNVARNADGGDLWITASSRHLADGARVLLIEDDIEAADAMTAQLCEAGWQVHPTGDGVQGLDLGCWQF